MVKRKSRVLLLSLFILLLSQEAFCQGKNLAPFKIVKADGSNFRAEDLPPGKPVIIIYFSPECEDCQKFTETMISGIDNFWDATIVMVTYLSVQSVADYVKKFRLNIYPNIYAGTEGTAFIVRYYYNVRKFPYVVLLDKNHNVVKIWNGAENADELAAKLKALH